MRSDMVTSVFLIALVLITLLVKYAEPLKDGDLWFQLAYGRYFIDNLTLIPDHTIFSWTPSDNSQIYCAWPAQIILYLLYKAGGLPILFVFRYLCLFSFVILVWIHAKRNNILWNPLTWLICMAGLLMSQSAALIKPEIFSFVFMNLMVWVWWLIKTSKSKRLVYCYLLPGLLLIWINTHGGVIFGMTFLGVLLVGEILNVLLSPKEKLDPKTRKHFIISLFLCVVVVFITPYGWEYPFQLINNIIIDSKEFKNHIMNIMAYQSIFYPDARHLHLVDYFIIACGILLILFLQRVKTLQFDWTLILMLVVFGLLYTRFLRTTYFFAPVFAFSSIYLLSNSQGLLLTNRKGVYNVFKVIIVSLCFFIAMRANYNTVCSPWFGFGINYCNPVEEAEFIRDHLSGLRLGNDYDSGAYLLWSLWPESKVFIDARYFPYKNWYSEYEYLSESINFDEFIKRYPCDFWCLTYDFPQVNNFIRSSDWRLVYYGSSACIFVSERIELPYGLKRVSEYIYKTDLFQAAKILHFALSIKDLDTARKIVDEIEVRFFCPEQRSVVIWLYNELALALEANEQFKEAIRYYNDSLSVKSDCSETHYYLANILVKLNKIDDAVRHYEEALRIEPDFASAHNNLGNAFILQGRIDEAIIHYHKAIQLNPDNPDAKNNLRNASEQKIKIDTAIVRLEEELRNNLNDSIILNNLSVLYSKKGDYEKALLYLQRLIEIKPENADGYYNIACIYSKRSNIDESIKWIHKALEKGFNDWDLIKEDPDLDNIRDSEDFKMLINDKTLCTGQ